MSAPQIQLVLRCHCTIAQNRMSGSSFMFPLQLRAGANDGDDDDDDDCRSELQLSMRPFLK